MTSLNILKGSQEVVVPESVCCKIIPGPATAVPVFNHLLPIFTHHNRPFGHICKCFCVLDELRTHCIPNPSIMFWTSLSDIGGSKAASVEILDPLKFRSGPLHQINKFHIPHAGHVTTSSKICIPFGAVWSTGKFVKVIARIHRFIHKHLDFCF